MHGVRTLNLIIFEILFFLIVKKKNNMHRLRGKKDLIIFACQWNIQMRATIPSRCQSSHSSIFNFFLAEFYSTNISFNLIYAELLEIGTVTNAETESRF